MQNEIKEKGALLDSAGALRERGYSKKMLLQYRRGDIKAGALRIKEWDYYIVTNGEIAVAMTIADNSYMGLHSVTLLDFSVPFERTNTIMTLLPLGKTNLPSDSFGGVTAFSNKRLDMRFERTGSRRHLSCRMDRFYDGKPFMCDITLVDLDEDSMVIATPFAEKKTAFYYNQKINCMPAEGFAEFDGVLYEFTPDCSFGTLDWGRGVWTYDNTWYWGSASGLVGGERFGFNIGYGFGDTTAASENMLFYKGKAHKLDRLSFNIPTKDGKDDFMTPWTFTSSDKRFEMDFVPIIDRAANISAVVISSDQHQVFGRFSGVAVLDDGTRLEIKDLLGFAEKVRNRY